MAKLCEICEHNLSTILRIESDYTLDICPGCALARAEDEVYDSLQILRHNEKITGLKSTIYIKGEPLTL